MSYLYCFLVCSEHLSDVDDDGDIFPTEEEMRHKQLRFEKEEFLKVGKHYCFKLISIIKLTMLQGYYENMKGYELKFRRQENFGQHQNRRITW